MWHSLIVFNCFQLYILHLLFVCYIINNNLYSFTKGSKLITFPLKSLLNKFLSTKEAQSKFKKIMGSGIDSFISKPVKNPIAKQWVKDQLKLKKAGLTK